MKFLSFSRYFLTFFLHFIFTIIDSVAHIQNLPLRLLRLKNPQFQDLSQSCFICQGRLHCGHKTQAICFDGTTALKKYAFASIMIIFIHLCFDIIYSFYLSRYKSDHDASIPEHCFPNPLLISSNQSHLIYSTQVIPTLTTSDDGKGQPKNEREVREEDQDDSGCEHVFNANKHNVLDPQLRNGNKLSNTGCFLGACVHDFIVKGNLIYYLLFPFIF